MVWRKLFTTLVAMGALHLPTGVFAALVTNPPRPIAYRVNVQLIQTALDDGLSPATVLGDNTQRADIESKVDSIWAQAGIDINFLPNVVKFNNTFAYQGSGGTRPDSDLSQILSAAAAKGGVLNPDPTVIDMFFVNVAPGWPAEGSDWVNGESDIGTNGIAEHIGSTIPASPSGRELAAHWISHEIGHNLGLNHPAAGTANLMNGTTRISDQLTSGQTDAILQWNFRNDAVAYIPQNGTGFPTLIPEPVRGDYNRDGTVNAADYGVWRDSLGSNSFMAADGNNDSTIDARDLVTWRANFGAHIVAPSLPGDFNRDGRVDAADYTVWRDSLGKTVAFGTGADVNLNGLVDLGDYAVWQTNFGRTLASVAGAASAVTPEPPALLLATIAAAALAACRYRQIR